MKSIRVDAPYPNVDLVQPNIVAANIISPAYAGLYGELDAIMQYIYQHFQFSYQGKINIAETLEGIAMAEMTHLDLIGSTLIRLGVNPIYSKRPPIRNNFYTTKDIKYFSNQNQMIEFSIYIEKQAILMYDNMLKSLNDPYVASIIERILQDEELHLEVFEKILSELKLEQETGMVQQHTQNYTKKYSKVEDKIDDIKQSFSNIKNDLMQKINESCDDTKKEN